MSPAKYKRKRMQAEQNYCLPEAMIECIKKKACITDILMTSKAVKEDWDSRNGWKGVMERNMLTCAAWYGHTAIIDYILHKWKSQQNINQRGHAVWASASRSVLSLPFCVAVFTGNTEAANLLSGQIDTVLKRVSINKIKSLPYWKDANTYQFEFGDQCISVPLLVNYTALSAPTVDALALILSTDDVNMLKVITKHKFASKILETCFYYCCCFKASMCAEHMLSLPGLKEKLININTQYKIEEYCYSPLMIAVSLDSKITKLLLEAGVDVNYTDFDHRNALHYAVGDKSMLRNPYGMKRCKDSEYIINIATKDSIFIAKSGGLLYKANRGPDLEKLETIKLLIEYGVNKCALAKIYTMDTMDRSPNFPEEKYTPLSLLLLYLKYPLSYIKWRGLKKSVKMLNEDEASLFTLSKDFVIDLINILMPRGEKGQLVFSKTEEEFPLLTWYNLTQQGMEQIDQRIISNSTSVSDQNSSNCNYSKVEAMNFGHKLMSIFLHMSVVCLEQLLAAGYTKKSCPTDDFGDNWLFRKIFKILKPQLLVYWNHTNINHTWKECPVNKLKEQLVIQVCGSYKCIIRRVLQAQFKYGTCVGEPIAEIEDITCSAHKKISAEFVSEVLRLLRSLSHKEYYVGVSLLEGSRSVSRADDSEDTENEEVQIPHRCLRNSIRAMDLGSQPRSLFDITRVVVFNAMSRETVWKLNKLQLPKCIEEDILTFN